MRERALVHVAGPKGAGKTTFIEAMIADLVGSDAFFMTRLMEDYSQAAVLKGDNPLGGTSEHVHGAGARQKLCRRSGWCADAAGAR